jgi:hypothetical protein
MNTNQKGFINIIVIICILLLAGAGLYFGTNKGVSPMPSPTPSPIPSPNPKPNPTPEPVACTQEAMQCPDGSYVSRTGSNCEFAKCPTTPVSADGYIAGHVTIGPFCPVEQEGHPCPVPPYAYTSREAVVYGLDGVTVKTKKHLDTEGNYKIALAPGTYFVQIDPAGIGAGEKKKVSVVSLKTSTVNFDIDTGIR